MTDTEELMLKEHQKWVRLALEEVDKILKRNNICFFLIEGSALGAVRHQDIIPWDDDVDIGIFLKDRNKVSEFLERELSDSFQYIDIRAQENYPRFYGKVVHNGRGCIDVFPLIQTGNTSGQRRMQWVKRKVLFKLYKAKIHYANSMETRNINEKIKVLFVRVCAFFVSKDFILRKVHNNEKQFESIIDNDNYINLYGAYGLEKELIRSVWIGNGKELLFGGKKYPVFQDTHSYLTNLYGDYMTLPPENQRAPHHEEVFTG